MAHPTDVGRATVKAAVKAIQVRGWQVACLGIEFDVCDRATDAGVGRTQTPSVSSITGAYASLGEVTVDYVRTSGGISFSAAHRKKAGEVRIT